MKRIAIPVINEKLSEYFGQCNQYKIFEINGKQVKSYLIEAPMNKEISLLPLWISDQGITDVVTYKIDRSIMELFANYKISLYIGIKSESSEDIILNYLKGTLKSDEAIISEIKKEK